MVIKVGSKEPFNSISINTSLIQQNGETFVNVNINARIDRGTAYQADLTNSDIIQTYYPKLKDEADKIASSFNDRKIIGGKSKGVKLVQRDPMNWASETGTISCGFRYSYALGKRGAGVVEYSANSTLSVVRPHRWYIIGDAYVKVLSAPMFRRMSFSGSMTLFDAKSVPKAYAGYKPPGGKWVKDGNDSVTSGDPKLSIDG